MIFLKKFSMQWRFLEDMIDRELIKKIKRIEISTKHSVTAAFAGEYKSAFKGQGIEFEEVREYIPGDEIRSIDWNVTARMGHPYIKRFREERELTIYLLVDLSASGSFGSTGKTKNEMTAEIASVLSYTAIRNNDRVGLLVFTDAVETFIPPGKGVRHITRIIREILNFQPKGKKTSISNALDFLGRMDKKGAVVFLLSDFIDTDYRAKMKVLSKKHDFIALLVSDPLEKNLPDLGLMEICDLETGERLLIDSSSRAVREAFEKQSRARVDNLRKTFAAVGIDMLDLVAGSDWVHTLLVFFLNRKGVL